MKDVLVSVVMTTYNGSKFLQIQLETIISQTHYNLEIIICDDASTDNTVNIIKTFAVKDPRISYYVHGNNLGVNKNFEFALKKATGAFIAIADQDDIWNKEKIEKQLDLFKDDNIVLTHTASVQFANDEVPFHKTIARVTHPMEGNDSRRLLLRNSISGHNLIFKKKLLEHVFPIPVGVYYDWWICEVATCIGSIAATNKILAYHRKHENNVTLFTRASTKQNLKEYKERIEALKTFQEIPEMSKDSRAFANKLLAAYKTLEGRTFSFTLYLFLMKNAGVLFFYKKKFFPWISYHKTAIRMSSLVK